MATAERKKNRSLKGAGSKAAAGAAALGNCGKSTLQSFVWSSGGINQRAPPPLPYTLKLTHTTVQVCTYIGINASKQSYFKQTQCVHRNSKIKRDKQESGCTGGTDNKSEAGTPSAMTKAANTDLTHDLKPRRLPLFQTYKTVTATSPPPFPPPSAPPVFTK